MTDENKKPETGGPAFPIPQWDNHHGMTLRDWFAGQALIGLAPTNCTNLEIAWSAYQLADAMLKVREWVQEAQP